MSDWCGGDCVWMGPEVERLTKENAALRDLVKRLVKELEPFCDGGCERDDVVKEACELNDIDKRSCDAFCTRVKTLEAMLAQQTETCNELRKENDRLTRKPK